MAGRITLLLWIYIAFVASQNIHNEKCPLYKCTTPRCRCSHAGSPDNLDPANTPQIVIFTFDDAVTKRDYVYYNKLFAPDRRNPNGCPIGMTMFVQHNYTDYDLVNKLHKRGMEVAVHSVTHRVPTDFWKSPPEAALKMEILTQRDNLYRKAQIPLKDITGWRSPFLQPSGEMQYDILKKNGFVYDSTLTTSRRTDEDNLWPFTLDYGWPLTCEVTPCPERRYAGLWEFPIAPLLAGSGSNRLSYTYVDSYRPQTGMQAFKFLMENFNAYYTNNRQPFMINMHTAWFYYTHNLHGMDLFIRTLLTRDDVYILTIQQALEWMKEPIPLRYTNTFKSWNCERPVARNTSKVRPTLFVPTTKPPPTKDPDWVPLVTCEQEVNCKKAKYCRCDGAYDYTALAKPKIPQMVLFTFDDAITASNEVFYNRLFPEGRRNPNGCSISMTMFIQHMYTDYGIVRKLYDRGNEAAVHSISHRYPNTWWKDAPRDELVDEVLGMRRNLETKSGIPRHHVLGWRSPFLQPSGDTLFELLNDDGFQYDSTLSVNRLSFESNQAWPFTLDYGWTRDCAIDVCPKKTYQGLWEFPIVALIDPITNLPCSYVDSCSPTTKQQAMTYLMSNFASYYNGSRAPFMLNMHAAWFQKAQNLDAMDDFIRALLEHDDVYILTVSQAMAWMKDPVSMDNIGQYIPWNCNWRPPRVGSTTKKPTTKFPEKSTKSSVVSSTPKVHVTGPGGWSGGDSGESSKRTTVSTGGNGDTYKRKEEPDGPQSVSLAWYVILLIGLVVVALLVIAILLVVSIVKKNQAIKVKRLAQMAAAISGTGVVTEGVDNPAIERENTLQTLKYISSSQENEMGNIYYNIMEMRKANQKLEDSNDNPGQNGDNRQRTSTPVRNGGDNPTTQRASTRSDTHFIQRAGPTRTDNKRRSEHNTQSTQQNPSRQDNRNSKHENRPRSNTSPQQRPTKPDANNHSRKQRHSRDKLPLTPRPTSHPPKPPGKPRAGTADTSKPRAGATDASKPRAGGADAPKSRMTSASNSSRYESDYETMRNSIMDDLTAFSESHARNSSMVSDSDYYYTIEDPWQGLNLRGDGDKQLPH